VSWIDIFAMNALTPVAFVSKDDVIHWPIIGTLARHNETIFLQRGSRGHAHTIGREMAERLQSGNWLAVFPEGTTTDGTHLHPFHGALLQPAIDAGAVTPVSLSYEDTRATARYSQPMRATRLFGKASVRSVGTSAGRAFTIGADPTDSGAVAQTLAHTLMPSDKLYS
jgi:1-acyl-sn-glycerol-3-phosphate acyltransferase